MAFDSILRNGIALIDSITDNGGLQADVVHHPWIADGSTYGEPTYGASVTRSAIVEEKQRLRRLADGREVNQVASITFPRPIAANGATNRREPIDPRDKFVLPSGFTGPIAHVGGLGPVDPITGKSYGLEVIIGTVVTYG